MDLERLVELWIEHSAAIDDSRRQLLPLRPVHYLNVATQPGRCLSRGDEWRHAAYV
jgi:hypothetical protein